MSTHTHWTTWPDVRERLRRRWEKGEFLRAWASGATLEPIDVALRGPAAGELADRFDDVRAWRLEWLAAQQRTGAFQLTARTVGGRSIGSNTLPARLRLEQWDDLWRALGVAGDVRRFAELRAATQADSARLAEWMNAHPMVVLAHEGTWPALVLTVEWLAAERGRGRYLRQVPVPGVDTKFIEANKTVLADLLDWILPAGAVEPNLPRARFAQRYGFESRPVYVRFRLLGAAATVRGGTPGDRTVGGGAPGEPAAGEPAAGLSELSVRAAEFTAVAPDVTTVYIVENEVTYLAFPDVADSVVIFGSGYALSAIASVPWLATRRVLYWGDIDTHGFAILDRLRACLPQVESFLMDRATLLDHRNQWVREGTPVAAPLPNLTDDEAALYQDLVEDVLGPGVRLEQERVSFVSLERTLHAARWTGGRDSTNSTW